jgi:ABC-2 type transport system permease protein
MNSLKAYFWKETLEIVRTKRYLVFGVVFLFFAFLDPVMIKLLPEILKSTGSSVPVESLGFSVNLPSALGTYAKDMFQTITIVVALSLMGLTAGEKKDKTLVLPKLAGLDVKGAVISKLIVNGVLVILFTVMGFLLAFAYSSVIFPSQSVVGLKEVFLSSLIFSIHFIYITALCIFFGTVKSSKVFAGIMTIVVSYAGALFGLIPNIKEYLPNFLIEAGSKFKPDADVLKSIAVTFIIVIILIIISITNVKKSEK